MGGHFDIPSLLEKLDSLKKESLDPNFYDNIKRASEVNIEISKLEEKINSYDDINKRISTDLELIDLVDESELKDLKYIIDKMELSVYLSGEFDNLNCYLEIHPGAGGTESCDWTSMLARMYQRYCEKMNYKYEIIDEQAGDEAGTKSITMKISGELIYGYLKNENGVHRLVRISPFDSNKRRHTSFASVSIMPEINTDINIEIKEEDLKIDVYHSSGAGGQSVNTSNSAVRITHLPTKTVVTCQNERSQLKNKEQAMKMLKNKLYMLEFEKKQKEIDSLKGESASINFGSQIRSYILEPYKMVKDHRTGFESYEPDKILDGNIEEMLTYNLKNI